MGADVRQLEETGWIALGIMTLYLTFFAWGTVEAARVVGRPVWLFKRARGTERLAAVGCGRLSPGLCPSASRAIGVAGLSDAAQAGPALDRRSVLRFGYRGCASCRGRGNAGLRGADIHGGILAGWCPEGEKWSLSHRRSFRFQSQPNLCGARAAADRSGGGGPVLSNASWRFSSLPSQPRFRSEQMSASCFLISGFTGGGCHGQK